MITKIIDKIKQTYTMLTLKDIRKYLTKGDMTLIYLSIFLSLAGSGAKVVIPTVIGELFEAMAESNTKATAFGLEFSLMELISLGLTCTFYLRMMPDFQRFFLASSESSITKNLSININKKSHSLVLEKHQQLKNEIQRSYMLIQNDCSQLPTHVIQNCIPSIMDISLGITTLWFSYGKVFGVGLFMLALSEIIIWDKFLLYCTRIEQKIDINSRSNMQFIQHEFESLNCTETIRVSNHQELEMNISQDYLSKFVESKKNYTMTSALYNIGLLMLIVITSIGCAAYLYFTDIIKNHIKKSDIDDLAFLFIYIIPFINSIMTLNNSLLAAKNAICSVHTIDRILNENSEEHDKIINSDVINLLRNEQLLLPLKDTTCLPITFENVSFRYNGNPLILDNLNFTIPAGKVAAIVGKSGAGKSTIVKLLFRFITPTGGRIMLGNHDILSIPLSILRSLISYMPQTADLFQSQSLEYNILYGTDKEEYLLNLWRCSEQQKGNFKPQTVPSKHVDEESLLINDLKDEEKREGWANHSVSNALSNVALSKYSAQAKENVTNTFSGGEKQRVSLARAIVKNSSIFVVDEPTSNLDSSTEAKVLSNIKQYTNYRTTIFITHRLSTIKSVDQILFLDKGKIVEQGTHQDLMEKRENYYTLYQMQNN